MIDKTDKILVIHPKALQKLGKTKEQLGLEYTVEVQVTDCCPIDQFYMVPKSEMELHRTGELQFPNRSERRKQDKNGNKKKRAKNNRRKRK